MLKVKIEIKKLERLLLRNRGNHAESEDRNQEAREAFVKK